MSAMKARLLKGGMNGLPTPGVPGTDGQPVIDNRYKPIQSFFDYRGQAVGAQALIANPPGTQIISKVSRNDSGYSIGLAPWSESPVAVSFKVGGQNGTSQPLILKPGQIMRPQGKASGATRAVNFNGFEYGLPAGWPGGGLVSLFVFPSPDAEVKWDATFNQVLFHCQQLQIRITDTVPPASLKNWPVRFPWADGARYDATNNVALEQDGKAALSIVETTRVMLRLRGNIALANPEACRACLWGTDAFEHAADGLAVNQSQGYFYDFAWPGNQVVAGMAANDPIVDLPTSFFGIGGSLAGLTLDVADGSVLEDAIVDVVRYGRLG